MISYRTASSDTPDDVLSDDVINKQREKQRRQYAYLQELQTMAKELPSKYQVKFNHSLVSLVDSLLDGMVFEIVAGSAEIQRHMEGELFNGRKKMVHDFAVEKEKMIAKHKNALFKCETTPHNRALVERENKEELAQFEKRRRDELICYDKRVVERLDLQREKQQVILEKAGISYFFITDDPEELTLQMHVLEFIARLSSAGI